MNEPHMEMMIKQKPNHPADMDNSTVKTGIFTTTDHSAIREKTKATGNYAFLIIRLLLYMYYYLIFIHLYN